MKQQKRMRQHNENIETEVSKTLKLLDEVASIQLTHKFRTSLMSRLEREIVQEKAGRHFGFRVDYRLAFMMLLFVINLGSTMLSVQQGDGSMATISAVPYNQTDDYSNQEFAYYDQTASYENQTPVIVQ